MKSIQCNFSNCVETKVRLTMTMTTDILDVRPDRETCEGNKRMCLKLLQLYMYQAKENILSFIIQLDFEKLFSLDECYYKSHFIYTNHDF